MSAPAKRARTDGDDVLAGKKVGFIGAGMMASAFIKGLISAGVVPPSHLAASDLSSASTQRLQAATQESMQASGQRTPVVGEKAASRAAAECSAT